MVVSTIVIPIFVLLELHVTISVQQTCLPKIKSVIGFAMDNKYTNRTLKTKDYGTCLMKCKKDEACMSSNFHMEKLQCEINTQTRESRSAMFKIRANSIYTPTFRTPKPVKGTKEFPAISCLDILLSNESIGTGDHYWIDPANTGIPFRVLCDMDTDGGGWTIAKRLVLDSTIIPPRLITTNYRDVSLYDSQANNIFPTGSFMGALKAKIGFNQIHFYCHKKSVGRVVSIVTKKNGTLGTNVIRFFTNDAYALSNFPDACGSFDRLAEDTALISQTCSLWGRGPSKKLRVNKWGYYDWNSDNRLNTRPFTSDGITNTFGFHRNNNINVGVCDDAANAPLPYTVGDKWQISVR